MLVEEWRGNHLLYFLDGQKIPFAFGHLDFSVISSLYQGFDSINFSRTASFNAVRKVV